MTDLKEYRVTCAGMFPHGVLTKRGETFRMHPDSAEQQRCRNPHLTFEAVEDETKRAMDKAGRQADPEAVARLQPSSKPNKRTKKRGK